MVCFARLVAKSVPLVGTTIGLALLALGGTLPLLLAYLLHGPNWQFDTLPIGFVAANPFVLGRTGLDGDVVYAFLVVWAVFGLVVNIPWFSQQWQAFRRYEPKPISPPPRWRKSRRWSMPEDLRQYLIEGEQAGAPIWAGGAARRPGDSRVAVGPCSR